MKSKKTKVVVALLTCFTVLGLSGCKKEEVKPSKAEIQFKKNVEAAPGIDPKAQKFIDQSYGFLTDEEISFAKKKAEEENKEVVYPKPENSTSVGKEMSFMLATKSRNQLLKENRKTLISIFVNGVIRDEYNVAANVLFGKEDMDKYKKEFKDHMLKETGIEGETTYIDRFSLHSQMEDGEALRGEVDSMIMLLNKTYLSVVIDNDLGDKVTANTATFGLTMSSTLDKFANDTLNFVKLEDTESGLKTDKDKENLHKFYVESVGVALDKMPIAGQSTEGSLGGFEKREDGAWVPVDMEKFTENVLMVVYDN